MILDPFVVAKMRLVARWGLFRTTVRLFAQTARTGQTVHAYFIGGMLTRSLLGSAAITMALVVALTPTGLPAWVVWACVVIGFSAFHIGLAATLAPSRAGPWTSSRNPPRNASCGTTFLAHRSSAAARWPAAHRTGP
jgi:hypothetical protein